MGSAAFKSAKNIDIKRTKIKPINIRRENQTIERNTNDNKKDPLQDDELKNVGCFSFSRRPTASTTGITRSRNKSESKILEVSDSLQQNILMSTENPNAIISTPVVPLTSQAKENTTTSSVTINSVHPTPTVSECSLPQIPVSSSNLICNNNLVGVSEKCKDKCKENSSSPTISLPKITSAGKQHSKSLSISSCNKSTHDQLSNVCELIGEKSNVSNSESNRAVLSKTQHSSPDTDCHAQAENLNTSVSCVKTKTSNSTTENGQIYVTSKSSIEPSCLESNIKENKIDKSKGNNDSNNQVAVPETLGELLNRREPLQPSTLYAYCESQIKQSDESKTDSEKRKENAPSSLFPQKKLLPKRLEPITGTLNSCDGCKVSHDLTPGLRLGGGLPPVPPPMPPPAPRPPSAADIQREAMEEGLQPKAGRGGCAFFLPSTEAGLQTPPPRPQSVAGRVSRPRRSTLSSEEKMLMAQVNRQLQLAKRREFARRNNLQVSRVSSACSLRAASPAPGLTGAQGDTPTQQPTPNQQPTPTTPVTSDLAPRPPTSRPPSGKAPRQEKSPVPPKSETSIITVTPTTNTTNTTTTTTATAAAAAVPEDAPAAGDSTAVGVSASAKLGSAGRSAAKPLTPAEIAAKSFMEDIFKEFEDI